MNLDRHIDAHSDLFLHLVKGDGDSAHEASRILRRVSRRHGPDRRVSICRPSTPCSSATPCRRATMTHRGRPVDLGAIRNAALLTVEGEHDDISGVGQTEAAHKLCVNIPAEQQGALPAAGVGHYGVFNGSRFRSEIAPRIADFILSIQTPAKIAAPPGCAPAAEGGELAAAVAPDVAQISADLLICGRRDSGFRKNVPARLALSPAERTADDPDRLRPGDLSGAHPPPPPGAPLYAAHPRRDAARSS